MSPKYLIISSLWSTVLWLFLLVVLKWMPKELGAKKKEREKERRRRGGERMEKRVGGGQVGR